MIYGSIDMPPRQFEASAEPARAREQVDTSKARMFLGER
jgi:hypothetical protein